MQLAVTWSISWICQFSSKTTEASIWTHLKCSDTKFLNIWRKHRLCENVKPWRLFACIGTHKIVVSLSLQATWNFVNYWLNHCEHQSLLFIISTGVGMHMSLRWESTELESERLSPISAFFCGSRSWSKWFLYRGTCRLSVLPINQSIKQSISQSLSVLSNCTFIHCEGRTINMRRSDSR